MLKKIIDIEYEIIYNYKLWKFHWIMQNKKRNIQKK